MKYLSYSLFILFLIFGGCRSDVDEITVDKKQDDPVRLIYTSLSGRVMDADGNPLSSAIVRLRESVTQTDASGVFHFWRIPVNRAGENISVEKPGYFKGYSHSNFTADGKSYTEVSLMSKSNGGTPEMINPSIDNSFTTNDGLKITVPARAITKANGDVYLNNTSIASKWINPTAENLADIMPGALTAFEENSDGSKSPLVLTTFGMIAIDITDQSGTEQLSIDPEIGVKVEIPIPEELLDSAPEEIPLWVFDEDEGGWFLNDACQKEGAYYVCRIVKGGFWNCDISRPAICLSGQFFNSDSTYAPYMRVEVQDLTENFIYSGFTDSVGYFCGSVPGEASLLLTVKDHCGQVLYSEEIGPFTEDFDLGSIYFNENVAEFVVNVTATILHCETADVPDGHLAIRTPAQLEVIPFYNGGFNFDIQLYCVAFPEIEYQVYSTHQPYRTIPVVQDVVEDIDLGMLYTCDTLIDYFNLTYFNADFWTAPTQFYYKNNENSGIMVLEGLSARGNFVLELPNYSGVGIYDQGGLLEVIPNANHPNLFPAYSTEGDNLIVEITTSDSVFISGTLTTSEGTSGEFKIRNGL